MKSVPEIENENKNKWNKEEKGERFSEVINCENGASNRDEREKRFYREVAEELPEAGFFRASGMGVKFVHLKSSFHAQNEANNRQKREHWPEKNERQRKDGLKNEGEEPQEDDKKANGGADKARNELVKKFFEECRVR